MGVRFIGDPDADLKRFIKQKEDRLYAALAAAMIVIVHDAEWNAVVGSGDRVDTYAMIEAISSKVEFKAKSIIGEVGFIDDVQDYYLYQTVTGFRHWLSGERINPTGALANAAIQASKDAEDAIEQAIRSVA